ncbi:MAG TPA: bifunctional lytic transglycosylase/C40 family peptidase [Actinomycetes bacterium]|nr:bifunctional lytic transglycosylase/C40 family peptidase [Actinomycetes bacterium]
MRTLAVLLTGLAVVMVLLLAAAAAALGGASSDGAGLSSTSRIPGELVPLIERAADASCDLSAPLLAAVLKVESNFNNTAVNQDSGAFTMAQFLPRTWAEWAVNANPDEDATADPTDPADVVFTAARYLCALGAGNPDTQRLAIAAYNAGPTAVQRAGGIPHEAECPDGHPASLDKFCETADYVGKVFAQAAAFAADSTAALPTRRLLARVIGFAYSKIGTPYEWGGDGRDGFFDCSGFTMRAYEQAGVQLPRTSRLQYLASPHVGQDDLEIGDLLFWAHDTSNPATIHHVAIYLGRDRSGTGWMIDAPHTGATIQIRRIYWTGYIGATRPLG